MKSHAEVNFTVATKLQMLQVAQHCIHLVVHEYAAMYGQ